MLLFVAAFIKWQKGLDLTMIQRGGLFGEQAVQDHESRPQILEDNRQQFGGGHGVSLTCPKNSVPGVWGLGANLPRTAQLVALGGDVGSNSPSAIGCG